MKSSTPLIRVVTEGLFLGAYDASGADFKILLFLASYDGAWTVGGGYLSVEDGVLWRLHMSRNTFKDAIKRLVKAQVVATSKSGYSTTYALTEQFLSRCRALYDVRWERDLIARYHNEPGCLDTLGRVLEHPGQGAWTPQHQEDGNKTEERRTANAARPDGRAEEEPMSDTPNDGFYDTPRPGKWGGKSEGTPLGGEQSAGAPKTIKHSPPRGKDVLAVKAYFQSKLQAFSDERHVPLWERVDKMHNNIQFLIKQGHSQDTLERAIDFFVSQAPMMMFQGTSLWDQFFAHREDALKFAAVAGIGSRGGPREDSVARAKRLSQHQQQTRSK